MNLKKKSVISFFCSPRVVQKLNDAIKLAASLDNHATGAQQLSKVFIWCPLANGKYKTMSMYSYAAKLIREMRTAKVNPRAEITAQKQRKSQMWTKPKTLEIMH